MGIITDNDFSGFVMPGKVPGTPRRRVILGTLKTGNYRANLRASITTKMFINNN
jgi:hypothetical protein